MRLFIAVPVPEELKKKIKEVQNKLAGISGIKLVEAKNLHFTIKFLGETDKVKEIEAAMEKTLKGFPQFNVEIAGISAFPSKICARVIWLSIGSGFGESISLMKNIDAELSRIGFEQDKEYIPHITLARVRSGKNKAKFIRLLEKLERTQIETMRVKEVKLMKSVLSRYGPDYEEIYNVKLKRLFRLSFLCSRFVHLFIVTSRIIFTCTSRLYLIVSFHVK